MDSSDMAASPSASWSRFSPPSNFVNGHVSTMWLTVCRWPRSDEGDWTRPRSCKLARHGRALICPETVHQRLFITREIETWLSDSRVGKNSVVDHRSRRPVLSPLRNCVDRCHVMRSGASLQLSDYAQDFYALLYTVVPL